MAVIRTEPWWFSLFYQIPYALVLLAGAVWLLTGGERGTTIEMVDGARRVSVTNFGPLAYPHVRAAIEQFSRPALPQPYRRVVEGSPADPGSAVREPAPLPEAVASTDEVIEIPPGAIKVIGAQPSAPKGGEAESH